VAAAIACAVGSAAAHAQDVAPLRNGADKGPPTLMDLILGPGVARESEAEPDRIDPDRPHLPDASTTVGVGRVVVESGYTYARKDDTHVVQTYPEALLRVGAFAEWLELRVGQSFVDERQTVAGTRTTARGAQDLYLGAKLALTRQDGLLPATAIIPQMMVPTGSGEVTAGRVLPGVNLDFNWDVIKDRFGVELLIADNLVRDDIVGSHHEVTTGLTGVVQLSKNLEGFVEWDAFVPVGAHDASGPRHYAVGGFVYFVTPDLAVDIRAGVGLNDHADDFIAGLGFALRR
jgi:hypothetical protein